MLGKEIVENLNRAIEALLKEASELGPSEERTTRVVDIVRVVLEDGLEGNRSVRPFIWSVVRQVGRAYPITFHSSIDKVRALGRQNCLDREQVEDVWIKQALHEGVLSSLLTNIIRQFQIRTAYTSDAIICDKECRLQMGKIFDRLKGVIQPIPDAPSVSSWSSEDSIVNSPRSSSMDVENGVSTTTAGRSPCELHCVEKKFKNGKEQRGDIVPAVTIARSQSQDTYPRLRLVRETPFHDLLSENSCDEENGEMTPALDRVSFLGKITRSLSGTMGHSNSEPVFKETLSSKLSHEEQTCRFWSRERSQAVPASLLREVEKELGAGNTKHVTDEERSRAAQMLMKEINKVSRLVLQQYCSNGLPLSVDLYPLSKLLPLYQDAFEIGLRPRPSFPSTIMDTRWSDYENLIHERDITPYALLMSMQKVCPFEPLGLVAYPDDDEHDDSYRFQTWLKNCLLDKCLGNRMEKLLNKQEFLQGWYTPQAIITNEDLIQELITSCRNLDPVSIEGADERQKFEANKIIHHEGSILGFVEDVKDSEVLKSHPVEDVTVRLSTDGSDAEGSCNTEGMKLLQAHSIEDLSSCSNDSNSSRSESRGLSLETKHQSIELHQELLNVIRAMDSPIVDSLAIPKTRSENARRYADKHSERMVHQPANRTPSFPLQLKDFESSISSSQDSPYSLQISTASAHSGKSRHGDLSRYGKAHKRSISVVSSCISGEDEEDWRGVWRDVDIVRYEMRTSPQGEQYVVYIIELVASDGTHWQTARRFSDLVTLSKTLIKQEVELPQSWANLNKIKAVNGKKRFSNEVIEARLAMLRQCLWDLMMVFPESLIWTAVAQFLDAPLSLLRATKSRQRTGLYADDKVKDLVTERMATHQHSMALIVDLPANVSDETLYEMQGGICAGCEVFLPNIRQQRSMFHTSTSPRKCDYTGLLFCHKCHRMENAYLPSRVLHCWDFSKYPVSLSAKTYINSIFTSPVLCIHAINPGLLASVPVLAHLEQLRRQIVEKMDKLRSKGMEGKRIALSLEENAGGNKHLIQNAEYWSMKDLADISRGVFARLPRWLEAVNKEIGTLVDVDN